MRGTAALLAMLFLVPTSVAFSFAPDVRVPAPHEGDVYSWTRTVSDRADDGSASNDAAPGTSTLVVRIGAASVVQDAFGSPQQAIPFHEQITQGDAVRLDVTCWQMPASAQSLRQDYAVAPADFTWRTDFGLPPGTGLQTTTGYDLTPVTAYAPRSCDGYDTWAGGDHAAGDAMNLWAPTLVPGLPSYLVWAPSSPAVATSFEGRSALRFTFDVAKLTGGAVTGTWSIVLAEGIPAIAREEVHTVAVDDGVARHVDAVVKLHGYHPGSGPALAMGDAQPRAVDPAAERAPFDPQGFDDAAFDLPFTFAEAVAAFRADPRTDLGSFFVAHPRATLVAALYERHMPEPEGGSQVPDVETSDGGWALGFADGSSYWWGIVHRATGVGPAALPVKVTRAERLDWGKIGSSTQAPPQDAPTSAQWAKLIASSGLDPQRLESITYFAYGSGTSSWASLRASDLSYMFAHEGAQEGRSVVMDALHGALQEVSIKSARTTTAPALHGPGAIEGASSAPALGTIAAPTGLGLGVAGVTGLAILLLAVKFLLLPLFTRLRRDTLLENDVRARLYERVRAEPGIHLAELVDFAAIGQGATRHHLDQLAKHSLIVRLHDGGFLRHFAAGEVPPSVAHREALLRAASMREVYDHFRARPTSSLRDAGAALGLSAPTVHRCKKRLEKAGLLPAAAEAHVSART